MKQVNSVHSFSIQVLSRWQQILLKDQQEHPTRKQIEDTWVDRKQLEHIHEKVCVCILQKEKSKIQKGFLLSGICRWGYAE